MSENKAPEDASVATSMKAPEPKAPEAPVSTAKVIEYAEGPYAGTVRQDN